MTRAEARVGSTMHMTGNNSTVHSVGGSDRVKLSSWNPRLRFSKTFARRLLTFRPSALDSVWIFQDPDFAQVVL